MLRYQCGKCRDILLDASNKSVGNKYLCCSSAQKLLGISVGEERRTLQAIASDKTGSVLATTAQDLFCNQAEPERPLNWSHGELEVSMYPLWITKCLDEGNWLKGKLSCPVCQSKVGAFDFIGHHHCECGSTPVSSVHLFSKKIDVKMLPSPDVQKTDTSLKDSVSGCHTVLELRGKSHKKCHSWPGSVKDTLTNFIGTIFHSNYDLSLNKIAVLTSNKESIPDGQTMSRLKTENTERKAKLHEEKASTEDLDFDTLSVPEDIQCSVCFEILCKPHSCIPCLHVFCEPCLRLLVHWQENNPYIHCPVCRTLIAYTEANAELENAIMSNFVTLYAQRCEWFRGNEAAWKKYSLPGNRFQRHLPERLRAFGTPGMPALNAVFTSLLCLIFFFILFVPGVYLSSAVLEYVHVMSSDNLTGQFMKFFEGVDPQKTWGEVFDLASFLLGSGILTAAGIAAGSALVLYLVFLL